MRVLSVLVLLSTACSSERAGAPADAGVTRTPVSTDAQTSADTASGVPTFCGEPAPSTCPTSKPSYSKQVVPILDAKCNNCHVGAGGPWPLTDYQSVDDWRIQILQDILSCTMPPLDAGVALTTEERDVLAGWIVCKAPNN